MGSDELLLWFFSPSVPLLVVWSVEVSLDIEIVLEDGICPAASHAPSSIVMALRIIDLRILMLWVSEAVVAGAPTIVLQSEVLETQGMTVGFTFSDSCSDSLSNVLEIFRISIVHITSC